MKNKKLWKRLLAMALAVTMLFLVVACGNSSDANDTTDSGNQQGDVSNTSSSNEKDLPWLNVGELPIVAEGTEKTLTIAAVMTDETAEYENKFFYTFIEEVMNINVEFIPLTSANKAEKLPLLFASDELPDLIMGAGLSTTDLMNYGAQEGQLIDLAPYINEANMPNLTALYEAFPSYKEMITDGEGHIWSLGNIESVDRPNTLARYYINYDWLEDVEMDVPKTLDDFTEAMRAFKKLGNDIVPIGGSYTTNNPMRYILNAFGYLYREGQPAGLQIALRDGEVVLPVADREAYGAFLEYMNMLYEEGLIHQDFFTMDDLTTTTLAKEGKNGFYAEILSGDNYKEYWGAYPLTSDYNDVAQYPIDIGKLNVGQAVVTSSCEEVELAVAFLDWFYGSSDNYEKMPIKISHLGPSEINGYANLRDDIVPWAMVDGSEYRADFGAYSNMWEYVCHKIHLWAPFGNNYMYDENGKYMTYVDPVVDKVFSKYEKEDKSDSRHDEMWANSQMTGVAAQKAVAAKYMTEECFPLIVFFDAETQTRLNEQFVAIKEYAQSETAKFITGVRPLEEIDDYFDEIEVLGAVEYVKIYADYYANMK